MGACLKKASELWHENKNFLVVVCGGGQKTCDRDTFFGPCSPTMAVCLRQLDVSPESILEENLSLNAVESGAFTRRLFKNDLLNDRSLRSISIVAHNLSMIRFGRIFAYFFPGVFIRACPILDKQATDLSKKGQFEMQAFQTLESDLRKFSVAWEPSPQLRANRTGEDFVIKKISDSEFQFKRLIRGEVHPSNGPSCSIGTVKQKWDVARKWKVLRWKDGKWSEIKDDEQVGKLFEKLPVGTSMTFGVFEVLVVLDFAHHSVVSAARPELLSTLAANAQPISMMDMDALEKLSPADQTRLQSGRVTKDRCVSIADKVIKRLCLPPYFVETGASYHFDLLDVAEVECLCDSLSSTMKGGSLLARVKGHVKVIGDIHGQLEDLLDLFRSSNFPTKYTQGDIQSTTYIFNGDFIDRGRFDLEVATLLFCLAYRYPGRIVLLRGNHETEEVYSTYGFKDNCHKRLGRDDGDRFLRSVGKVFAVLPLACLIEKEVLVLHGGIGNGDWKVESLAELKVPMSSSDIGKNKVLLNILWSDPAKSDQVVGDHANHERGLAEVTSFSAETVEKFCVANSLKLVVRSHQCVKAGYEYFAKGRMMTVFSAANYMNKFGNNSALAEIWKEDNKWHCCAKVMRHARADVVNAPAFPPVAILPAQALMGFPDLPQAANFGLHGRDRAPRMINDQGDLLFVWPTEADGWGNNNQGAAGNFGPSLGQDARTGLALIGQVFPQHGDRMDIDNDRGRVEGFFNNMGKKKN
jgi:diadenosine tetraphosphatase ApaH/serine/threonine PP2A family protein phosphatase